MAALGLVAGLAGFASHTPGPFVPARTAATAPAVDQAQWLTRAQAVSAYRALQGQTEVMRLCQPCGKRVPVREAITRPVIAYVPDESNGDGHYEIVLLPSDDAVDLAYVYVRVGARWTNLARHIGMDVVRVTTILL